MGPKRREAPLQRLPHAHVAVSLQRRYPNETQTKRGAPAEAGQSSTRGVLDETQANDGVEGEVSYVNLLSPQGNPSSLQGTALTPHGNFVVPRYTLVALEGLAITSRKLALT